MAEGGQDKRHAPTPKRLREAAARGNVRRSPDLPKAAVIVCLTGIALAGAGGAGARLQALCAVALGQAGKATAADAAGWLALTIAAIGPLLLLVVAIAIAASLASGGWVLSLAPLRPDFSKLMPAYGLGQLVSKSGLTDTFKALIKFIIIGGIGAAMVMANRGNFAALASAASPSAGAALSLCLQIITPICAAIAVLAGGDMALQHWLHRQSLRMSDQEMRDEQKEGTGNPQIRQRQRMIARKLARARQMRRIPGASVIVTNPAHFAVAIRYQRGVDRAPLLLAKGTGLLAAEIVSRGRALGIPIVEAPPLARAVYRHVEPGDAVPVALYRACAEVLAYVWRMQRWRSQGGARPQPPKVREGEIEVTK